MTTFVYLSPNFPETGQFFCEHLRGSGVTILGVGDSPWQELPERLRQSLVDYVHVGDLGNYDQVLRALGWLTHKHGKIDWLESNNEFWLSLDARLRDDFNITTGHGSELAGPIRSKAAMKPVYRRAGIPTARQLPRLHRDEAHQFAAEVGYPLVVKPDAGIGATNTTKVTTADELDAALDRAGATPGVIEEFIAGDIISYDAIVDENGQPVFEAATQWPPSIMDIVVQGLDLTYRVLDEVPAQLQELGRATSQAFGMRNRFVHLEFFRLTEPRPGLGQVGDFVALEVNMRPAGGYTLDMFNFARGGDVYQIYTDLVTGHDTGAAAKAAADPQICVYAARRDVHQYRLSVAQLLDRYGPGIVKHQRNPEIFRTQMGDEFFMITTRNEDLADHFVADALDQA